MLALAESKRLVLSPMFGVGLAFIVVTTYQVRDNSAVSVYNALANAGPMAYVFGPLVLFAANAIASSSRFDDTEQLFGVAPVSASRRTLALCLAGIPAAVVALAVQYAALLLFRSVWHLHLTYTPSTWVMLATPLEVMGAVCLGVMIARWLPWRGAVIPAFLFVAVAVTFATGDALKGTRWLAPVLEFVRTDEGRATPVWLVGSAAWHAGYLLALAGMATVGAMLRVASRRTGLLGVGAVVTLAAIGAGWTQVG
jgi:hypothetical protein